MDKGKCPESENNSHLALIVICAIEKVYNEIYMSGQKVKMKGLFAAFSYFNAALNHGAALL